MKASVYLLTGTNVGNRLENLRGVNAEIAADIGEISALSSIYTTAAWGNEDQPTFLNQALEVFTVFSPRKVLEKIHQIEDRLGRQKRENWGPREIDIDILFYNDEVIDEEGLKIPHPYITERKFALAPLAEIAPELVHPFFNKNIVKLLAECKDPLPVEIYRKAL